MGNKKYDHNGINFIGEKFGELTVLSIINSNKGSSTVKYLCKCSCGNTKELQFSAFYYGKTKSCGCKTKEWISQKGSKPYGEAAFNSIYLDYKLKARKRKNEFLLEKDTFKILITSNCFYCNTPPSNIMRGRNGNFIYNGIDRIDNNIGYVKDNCVSCCKQCNYMKNVWSQNDFLNQIVRIYNNLYEK